MEYKISKGNLKICEICGEKATYHINDRFISLVCTKHYKYYKRHIKGV